MQLQNKSLHSLKLYRQVTGAMVKTVDEKPPPDIVLVQEKTST